MDPSLILGLVFVALGVAYLTVLTGERLGRKQTPRTAKWNQFFAGSLLTVCLGVGWLVKYWMHRG